MFSLWACGSSEHADCVRNSKRCTRERAGWAAIGIVFSLKILAVILLSPIIESHGVFKKLKFQRVFTLTKPSLAGRYINFGIYRLVEVLSNFGLVAQNFMTVSFLS